MKVSQLMTKNVSVADLETTLEEIATMMRDEDAGAIPVLDEGKVVGIVTDRDIVLRCIAEGRDPVGTTSEDILSADLTTIKPNDDVDRAAHLMAQRQVRRLPVVDESGKLLGMLSLGDIAVKEDGDTESAEALEGVSRGVKDEGGRRTGQANPHIERGRENDPEEFAIEVEEEEFQYAQPRQGSRNRRATSNRAAKERPEVNLKSRGKTKARGPQSAERTQSNRGQGISNRNAATEKKRQHKVIPIRGKASRSNRQKRVG
jgi:CBS domain-containing protein